jgi:hypothetical protein
MTYLTHHHHHHWRFSCELTIHYYHACVHSKSVNDRMSIHTHAYIPISALLWQTEHIDRMIMSHGKFIEIFIWQGYSIVVEFNLDIFISQYRLSSHTKIKMPLFIDNIFIEMNNSVACLIKVVPGQYIPNFSIITFRLRKE